MSKAYCCGVYFQHEMEDVSPIGEMFVSVEELELARECYVNCGIVELELGDFGEVLSHKWIVPQKSFRDTNGQ